MFDSVSADPSRRMRRLVDQSRLSSRTVMRMLHRVLFARGSRAETSRITSILRKETVGGALLLVRRRSLGVG